MMNKRFHRTLHLPSGWGIQLSIIGLYQTRGHVLKSSTDDAKTLAHLLYSKQVSIIAISSKSYRNSKIHGRVYIIRMNFSQIPWDPRAP
jgi:hypothetical protein